MSEQYQEVTRDEFFKTLYADKRDIMLSITQTIRDTVYKGSVLYESTWKNQHTRALFGKSIDIDTHSGQQKYFLVKGA